MCFACTVRGRRGRGALLNFNFFCISNFFTIFAHRFVNKILCRMKKHVLRFPCCYKGMLKKGNMVNRIIVFSLFLLASTAHGFAQQGCNLQLVPEGNNPCILDMNYDFSVIRAWNGLLSVATISWRIMARFVRLRGAMALTERLLSRRYNQTAPFAQVNFGLN